MRCDIFDKLRRSNLFSFDNIYYCLRYHRSLRNVFGNDNKTKVTFIRKRTKIEAP